MKYSKRLWYLPFFDLHLSSWHSQKSIYSSLDIHSLPFKLAKLICQTEMKPYYFIEAVKYQHQLHTVNNNNNKKAHANTSQSKLNRIWLVDFSAVCFWSEGKMCRAIESLSDGCHQKFEYVIYTNNSKNLYQRQLKIMYDCVGYLYFHSNTFKHTTTCNARAQLKSHSMFVLKCFHFCHLIIFFLHFKWGRVWQRKSRFAATKWKKGMNEKRTQQRSMWGRRIAKLFLKSEWKKGT